jgi:SAM-dependent methyltransferase
MKHALLLLVLVACAAPKPLVAPSCPPPPPPPAAPPAPVAPDEATIKAKSHELFDAYDRGDAAALKDLTGPTFGLYENERYQDRDYIVSVLEARTKRHAPIHSRTWGDERVLVDPYTAIFFGEATEHMPAEGSSDAVSDDGANTLVWVREGNRWVATSWVWFQAGIEAERARWNRWLIEGHGFNHKPNQLLVDTVKGRKPGTALDIATGQGRNAVFLATQGWKVTGVDIADEGLKFAREEAARQKTKLETVQSDIDKYDLGKDKWDLVTMIYAGNDAKLLERIKPAVKKGGLFVTEYFAADSEVAKTGAEGWDPKVLEAAFKDGWKILRDDHVEDNADWAGQRKTKLVRFVAQKL